MADVKTISPIDAVVFDFNNRIKEFENSLPKQLSVEKFTQSLIMCVRNNPKLLDCDRDSLQYAAKLAALDGLLLDGQEATIIPYKGKAKYMVMIKGVCKKVRNSGEISSMDAQVVYENDFYESWNDEKGAHYKHVKARKDRGAPILTYAYAIAKDGGFYFEEIDETQMQAIKKCSSASDSPWNGPFADEMRRKSAARRLGKYRLPMSSDLISFRDDDIYDLDNDTDKVEQTTSSRLNQAVDVDEPTKTDTAPAKSQDIKKEEPKKEQPTAAPKPPMTTAAPTSPGEPLSVQGTIEELKIMNVKKSDSTIVKKFACRIGKDWYGTFSESLYKEMADAADQNPKILIRIQYKERVGKDEKVYRDAISLKHLSFDDVPVEEEADDTVI